MSKEEIMFLTGKVKLLLFQNKHDEALMVLSDIINRLSTNDHQQDVDMKDVLMSSFMDRININFIKKKYEEVVTDVNAIQRLNFDIYDDEELFLIYQECLTTIFNNNNNMLNEF